MTKEADSRFFARLRRRNLILQWFPWLSEARDAWEGMSAGGSWREAGLPTPAPHPLKRAMLVREGRRIKADTLVETGTFTGDTVRYCQRAFRKIFSVEVQPELALIAQERFRRDAGVVVLAGDSARILPDILERVDGGVVFWLDGHFSAGVTGRGEEDCPLFAELRAIASHKPQRFSIAIDDLRLFGTDPAYPELEALKSVMAGDFPELGWETSLDIIWCRWRG